ncbi:hypothetical protein ELI15_02245 [Rhizobium ruizarguesonis]|uniref:AlgX/AlgJ SGNH hydrolase-like domain-containing protein n=2 Tax=Rhizobium ruizarguesonis TaxID=2081791 RepID=A0ABY1X474_9HYPH|nr:hypothetical protein [Rhizobium ruizarguesonis]TAU75033.1 hypothetical protein ELI46_02390 [Rhizobium ruizarguesonis]TAV31380.1 hypothetical protein ELI36_02245 [Rhizobium ruizarguesonis]TAV36134.1 hypothetical protein ELI33_02240 [Rhizobium ruizarguesonis]TAW63316.1 hypothetical protein ELI15_02245 [Rhizobium ruizarguesonis]TAX79997.1 hypothetical protein ELH98_02250 [Rhizobium ruizarguesonis]
MRVALKLLLPSVLLTALTCNAALTFMGWQAPSNVDENREMAKPPAWNDSLSAYVRGLDAWLTDNFAFRKPLVFAFNKALYSGFDSTLARNVVVGRDGWIFGAEFDGQGSVGPRTLSDEYIAKAKQALIERKAWLDKRGIHMLVLFMPTKTAIYGNRYMPESWHFDENLPTESEQLYKALNDIMPESIVPVRQAMIQASQTAELYYRTDPHATQHGTFVAFQQLASHIERYFPQIAPSAFPPYSLKIDYYQPTAFGRMMGLPFQDASWVPVPDGEYRFTSPPPPASTALLPVGSRLTYYENSHVRKVKVALMGDSFTNRMAAIFGEVFSQSATINLNNVFEDPDDKFPAAFLDAYRPDFAVFLFVESRLVECSQGCGEFPIINPDVVRSGE